MAPLLPIADVEHERHEFVFTGLQHVAAYLATSPKYDLPAELNGQQDVIATALGRHVTDEPVTATSTVTYLVAVQGHRS